MHPSFQAATLLALCAPTAARGGVALFEGPPAGTGSVRSYDESGGQLLASPPELVDIVILPIEASGRTALEEFLPGRARRIDDIAGASRLKLPRERGSLYHYRRGPAGARVFGYFTVDRDGLPQVLIERAAIGAALDTDPFLPRVAISPDGRSFLCATLPAAGGDLVEVRFSPLLEVVDRTAGAPPLRFSARGLALSSTHAWAVSGRGILRAARADSGPAALVGFGGETPPAFFSGELVQSSRGQSVAFTAGDSASALHAWTATSAGVARRASVAPATLSAAGASPDVADGPYLAVTDDGTWCAWRTEGATRECFTARVAAPVGELPEQLSSDARFLDTLDEVAVFFFRGPGQLVFAIGERPALPEVGPIENLDFFLTTLTPGAPPAIENLSLSSGDSTLPFLARPQLKPARAVLTPDRQSLVLHDEQGSGGDLLALSTGAPGLATLLPNVKSLDWVELAGRRFALGLQRSNGQKPHEVHSLPADLGGLPVFLATSTETEPITRPTGRVDGWAAWVVERLSGESLQRVHMPGTTVETWGGPSPYGEAATWTTGGALVFEDPFSPVVWPLPGAGSSALLVSGPLQILPGL